MTQKKKTMSREEAIELYNDLQKSMTAIMQGNAPAKAVKPKSSFFKAAAKSYAASNNKPVNIPVESNSLFANAPQASTKDRGIIAAVTFLMLCGFVKLGVGIIDYTGIFDAPAAQAVAIQQANVNLPKTQVAPNSGFTAEDLKILTQLDQRRVALEERSSRLDRKEAELQNRDKEFVVKLAEIKELTEKLRIEREKDQKKDTAQLEQLANIYGAMAPQESAKLIEQLDVSIALPLLQRMPEKRMGQILPLMSPEKALIMTKLLSGQR
jgi:flagellar motility protein MotE (MotC chaperone)